jgi:transposase
MRKRETRSPAKIRQQRLFTLKGQLASNISVLQNAVKEQELSISTRVNLQFALDNLWIAYQRFDKDVGWKR